MVTEKRSERIHSWAAWPQTHFSSIPRHWEYSRKASKQTINSNKEHLNVPQEALSALSPPHSLKSKCTLPRPCHTQHTCRCPWEPFTCSAVPALDQPGSPCCFLAGSSPPSFSRSLYPSLRLCPSAAASRKCSHPPGPCVEWAPLICPPTGILLHVSVQRPWCEYLVHSLWDVCSLQIVGSLGVGLLPVMFWALAADWALLPKNLWAELRKEGWKKGREERRRAERRRRGKNTKNYSSFLPSAVGRCWLWNVHFLLYLLPTLLYSCLFLSWTHAGFSPLKARASGRRG